MIIPKPRKPRNLLFVPFIRPRRYLGDTSIYPPRPRPEPVRAWEYEHARLERIALDAAGAVADHAALRPPAAVRATRRCGWCGRVIGVQQAMHFCSAACRQAFKDARQ